MIFAEGAGSDNKSSDQLLVCQFRQVNPAFSHLSNILFNIKYQWKDVLCAAGYFSWKQQHECHHAQFLPVIVTESHNFKGSAKPCAWVCIVAAPSPRSELQVNVHPSQLKHSKATEARRQKPAWLCLTGFQSYTLTWASGSSALYPSWARSLSGVKQPYKSEPAAIFCSRGYIRIQSTLQPCASEMNRLGTKEYAFLALRLNTPAAYGQAPAAALQSVLLCYGPLINTF